MTKKFELLKKLVEQDKGNEIICRDALCPFSSFLLADSNLTLTKTEWTSDRGRIDLMLIAEPINTQFGSPLFTTDKIVKVYELKSPDKNVFEYNSKSNRFAPSKDLILAETQLLDYTFRSTQDALYFQTRFGTNDIKMGGIVIGREKTMFKIAEKDEKKHSADDLHYLKTIALKSRANLLYRANGIELFNWDHLIK